MNLIETIVALFLFTAIALASSREIVHFYTQLHIIQKILEAETTLPYSVWQKCILQESGEALWYTCNSGDISRKVLIEGAL